jgi:hypothetical protein
MLAPVGFLIDGITPQPLGREAGTSTDAMMLRVAWFSKE